MGQYMLANIIVCDSGASMMGNYTSANFLEYRDKLPVVLPVNFCEIDMFEIAILPVSVLLPYESDGVYIIPATLRYGRPTCRCLARNHSDMHGSRKYDVALLLSFDE